MDETILSLDPTALKYVELSHSVAIDATYVQGGGGNVSVKREQMIFVKSSGTRLIEATATSGFVVMNIDMAKDCIIKGETLDTTVSKHSPQGRPSIEAPLHVMCAGEYVAHVHSVGAVALGLTSDCESVCRRNGWVAVDYVEPGRPLLEALSANSEFYSSSGTAILKNHGLLLWSSDLKECIGAVREVESLCRNYFLNSASEEKNFCQMVEAFSKEKNTIDFSGTKSGDWLKFVSTHTLVPDQAVFLTNIDFDGRVVGRNEVDISGLSITEIEMLQFLRSLGYLIETSQCISTVKEEEVKGLLGLESEKYRQGQSK